MRPEGDEAPSGPAANSGATLGTKSRWRISATEPTAPTKATTVAMTMSRLKAVVKPTW